LFILKQNYNNYLKVYKYTNFIYCSFFISSLFLCSLGNLDIKVGFLKSFKSNFFIQTTKSNRVILEAAIKYNTLTIMEGKGGRGRPRQKLLDWMMSEGYNKLKEEAQHRERWSHWRSGPPRGQRT